MSKNTLIKSGLREIIFYNSDVKYGLRQKDKALLRDEIFILP